MEIGGYIGAYRLEGPIGEGGMGAVWKARHPTLDRPVALKLIRSEVQASPQAREAFLREVRVLSRLHGPQILQVTDFGFTEAGDPYMVTEFLEGEDLLARVRRKGPLDALEVLPIGIEVLKALAEAHAVGLVHRDLKPGNVFLQKLAGGARTAVKVLDFGVAKLLEGSEEDTLWPGARLKGSPRYMAPEQVQGGLITPATDIYAFGAMLYRVLTGTPLFAGDRNAVLRGHLEQPPPPMNGRAPGLQVPDELEDIVFGCLEKAPGDRPGSAGALQARMERLARRLEDARSGGDHLAPSGLDLDWSINAAPGQVDAGTDPSGSLPVIGVARGGPAGAPDGDLGAWFRTTGELPTDLAAPASSPGAGSSAEGWGIEPPPPESRPPTGGWRLDMPSDDAPSAPPAIQSPPAPVGSPQPEQPDPATSEAVDLGDWGVDPAPTAAAPSAPAAAPAGAEPETAGLELDLGKARQAPVAGSMSGVQVVTGGLELQTGDHDDGLQLAFDPVSRAAPSPEEPAPDASSPADEQPPPDSAGDSGSSRAAHAPVADRVSRPTGPRSASVAVAGVSDAPWHVQHRIPLIAGGAVLSLLILIWFARSSFIDSAGVQAADAADAAAIVDAEARIFDLGGVPVVLDRGVAMLEVPSVARGPASHNGAPRPDQRPTVLIRPDPAPATFTRRDTGEVVCEASPDCRVPIDVDIVITRKGYRRIILEGDDLYDRRGSTWRVILRR